MRHLPHDFMDFAQAKTASRQRGNGMKKRPCMSDTRPSHSPPIARNLNADPSSEAETAIPIGNPLDLGAAIGLAMVVALAHIES